MSTSARSFPLRSLPPRLRVYAAAARRRRVTATDPYRPRHTINVAKRTLMPGTLYRSAEGVALRIDPADGFQVSMILGMWQREVVALLRRFVGAGTTVVDAGAHMGYITLLAARRVGPGGQVHAFECDPRLVDRLEEHVALNGASWVRVNPVALLDHSGDEVPFHLPSQLGWSSTRGGGEGDVVTVPTVALDDYLEGRGVEPESISFVKVDVEGAELDVLRGAQTTLRHATPAVVVEFLPVRMRELGDEPETLFGLMEGLGYRPWMASPRALRSWRFELVPHDRQTESEIVFLKA
ncbi:MAG: FkbM family methyltransferase [Acidimicrobiales bacterium]|nr:FkbM family methyltransferase [Acidimicrobiales bacterium]